MRRYLYKGVTFLAFLTLASCAKISGFDEPYMQEAFTGSCSITSTVKGLPAVRPPAIVVINGNDTGREVTIAGVMGTDPFYIVPKEIILTSGDKKGITDAIKFLNLPSVSGLLGEPLDATTIRIKGFAFMSDSAKDMELSATGEFVREGPQIATRKPVIISVKLKPFKQFLSENISPLILDHLRSATTKKTLAEMDDGGMLALYRIDCRSQIITVL